MKRIQVLYNNKINRMTQEYCGIMHRKTGSITSYFEEEETLAYAEVINQSVRISNNDMEFDIAVLNKENDETISFTVPVPNRAMYTKVYVEDIQMTDDTLKFVTRNFSKN